MLTFSTWKVQFGKARVGKDEWKSGRVGEWKSGRVGGWESGRWNEYEPRGEEDMRDKEEEEEKGNSFPNQAIAIAKWSNSKRGEGALELTLVPFPITPL